MCPEKTPAIDLRDKFRHVKKLCLEIFPGVGRLNAASRLLGLGVGEPWEALPAKKVYLECFDLLLPQNVVRLLLEIRASCHFHIHFGMPCILFSTLQNPNHGARSLENPWGDGTLCREVLGNKLADIVSMLCLELFQKWVPMPPSRILKAHAFGDMAQLPGCLRSLLMWILTNVDTGSCLLLLLQIPNNPSK